MKAIKIFAILAMAVFVMSSCNPEKEPPTIKWDGNISKMHNPADGAFSHELTLKLTAEAGIKEFKIMKYVQKGTDITPSSVDVNNSAEIIGKTSYDYAFAINLAAEDFAGGVTKIIYEFTIIDNDLNEKAEEFTIFVDEMFKVTFVVKNQAGDLLEGAIITLGTQVNEANDYVFEYVAPEKYSYKVEKTGYETVEVAEVEVEADMIIEVKLNKNLADAYSTDIPLKLKGYGATYNGETLTTHESEVIGFAFTYTDATTVRVTKTDNCDGWVVLANDNINTVEALKELYNDGDKINQYDLPYDQHKAYAARYFASKVGDNYLLVKYVAGYRDSTTGNVVVFQYKN